VSVIGHVTSDELRWLLDATEAGNGFGTVVPGLDVGVDRRFSDVHRPAAVTSDVVEVRPEGWKHDVIPVLSKRRQQSWQLLRSLKQILGRGRRSEVRYPPGK
jgi:hypothetical protein